MRYLGPARIWISASWLVACASPGQGAVGGESDTVASSDGTSAGSGDDLVDDTAAANDDGDGDSSGPATSTTGPGDDDGDASSGSTGAEDPGPRVDVSDPQLYAYEFAPSDADPAATAHDAIELAYLDTTVTPIGRLVVHLHGVGAPAVCGSRPHGRMLAGLGFHVISPCYVADYGLGNCGDEMGDCRLEAFDGIDHTDIVDIAPADATEVRVVQALHWLQAMHPGGDWAYYLDGETPRWDRIVISGLSHGATSAAVVGYHRDVERVVSLSGPLDVDQPWMLQTPVTPIDRFFALSHTADDQHGGHLHSWDVMMLLGTPTSVDDATPPYGDSHRLQTSVATDNGHGSTQASTASPKDADGEWVLLPAWRQMYGVD